MQTPVPARAMKIRRLESIATAIPSIHAPAIQQRNVFIRTWGHKGNADGEFSDPSGVAVSMHHVIYVADSQGHRIHSFHSNGTFIQKWGKYGRDDGEFKYPQGVSIGICDGIQQSIMNEMIAIPELYAFPPGVLPICVAYVGDEEIYVCDLCNHRIQVFGCDGKFIRKWGSEGDGDGQFLWPCGCSVDNDGTLYVSDTWNHRIQVFECDGTFIRKWGSHGSGDGQFQLPGSTSVNNGLIYIADEKNRRVVCYHVDGTIARSWTPPHNVFRKPEGVMVNDDGMVYVADVGNDSILQFRGDGTLIRKWGSDKGRGDGQFDNPMAIAKGMNGVMYVVDRYNKRIVVMEMKYD